MDLRSPPGNRLEALSGDWAGFHSTPETAWLLTAAFGATPQRWLNLQTNYDLALHRPTHTVPPLALVAQT